jgi:hypothetical protein
MDPMQDEFRRKDFLSRSKSISKEEVANDFQIIEKDFLRSYDLFVLANSILRVEGLPASGGYM